MITVNETKLFLVEVIFAVVQTKVQVDMPGS